MLAINSKTRSRRLSAESTGYELKDAFLQVQRILARYSRLQELGGTMQSFIPNFGDTTTLAVDAAQSLYNDFVDIERGHQYRSLA